MQDQPILFDRASLARHRVRAGRDPALFLHEAVASEIEERVTEVNRTFTKVAIVTPWPAVWEGRFPGATIVGDSETLDLTQGAHDLVIHALCLHWANDPVGQLVQCRHALEPDGMLLATLFGGGTLQELRRCLAEAETKVMGGLSPRVAPMGEIRDLGALLQRAGFTLPVADNVLLTVTYDNAIRLMQDLRAMGETNAMAARMRHVTPKAVMMEAARLYAEAFADGDGRVPASFDIITLTGWSPGPNQPQPLRPGSAQQRLADALQTFEMPIEPERD